MLPDLNCMDRNSTIYTMCRKEILHAKSCTNIMFFFPLFSIVIIPYCSHFFSVGFNRSSRTNSNTVFFKNKLAKYCKKSAYITFVLPVQIVFFFHLAYLTSGSNNNNREKTNRLFWELESKSSTDHNNDSPPTN